MCVCSVIETVPQAGRERSAESAVEKGWKSEEERKQEHAKLRGRNGPLLKRSNHPGYSWRPFIPQSLCHVGVSSPCYTGSSSTPIMLRICHGLSWFHKWLRHPNFTGSCTVNSPTWNSLTLLMAQADSHNYMTMTTVFLLFLKFPNRNQCPLWYFITSKIDTCQICIFYVKTTENPT
jgi:hypothetical protein